MADGMGLTRRRVIGGGVAALGSVVGPARGWAQFGLTPRQSRGPFYPAELPLDRDNDLVTVAGSAVRARGEIAHVIGRVLDERGRPVRDARVEIWQCDANGRYRHPGDRRDVPLDPGFQGYGHFVTGAEGAYRFRTIKPVPYPGRAPHIHYAISGPGFEPLVTQLYVAGAPENARDFLLNGIPDPAARARLIVPFRGEPGVAAGELVARFEIVLAADGRFGRPPAYYRRLRG